MASRPHWAERPVNRLFIPFAGTFQVDCDEYPARFAIPLKSVANFHI
jgi:hypothetical protein